MTTNRSEIVVNEINAASFSDNFTVIDVDGIKFAGCEHNAQEAFAIAKWLTSQGGSRYIVETNTRKQVADSRRIRGGVVTRFEYRADALRDMGVA